jgi:hypothetical protein
MNDILASIRELVNRGEVRVSIHGFRELAADDILLESVVAGIDVAVPVEQYPEFAKGPCVLALQRDHDERPLHVVWGIPKGQPTPAVLVTAYRPDPERWSEDFMRRRKP